MAHANVTRTSFIMFLTLPPHSVTSAAISARQSTDVYFKDFQALTVAGVGAGGEKGPPWGLVEAAEAARRPAMY